MENQDIQEIKVLLEKNNKLLENLYNLFIQYDRNYQDNLNQEILRDQGIKLWKK